MILIDTDHLTHLSFPDTQRGRRLIERLESVSAEEVIGVTIISIEERMRGWLAVLAKEKLVPRQVTAYNELIRLFEFYQEFEIVPFDSAAAQCFESLRIQRIRIGTMDLKIAATAVSKQAILLSANLQDFRRVPNLNVQNWIDE